MFSFKTLTGEAIFSCDEDCHCTTVGDALNRGINLGIPFNDADLTNMDLRNVRFCDRIYPFKGALFRGSIIDETALPFLRGAVLIGASMFIKGFKDPDRLIPIVTQPKFLTFNATNVVIVGEWIHIRRMTVHGPFMVTGKLDYWDQNYEAIDYNQWPCIRADVMAALEAP